MPENEITKLLSSLISLQDHKQVQAVLDVENSILTQSNLDETYKNKLLIDFANMFESDFYYPTTSIMGKAIIDFDKAIISSLIKHAREKREIDLLETSCMEVELALSTNGKRTYFLYPLAAAIYRYKVDAVKFLLKAEVYAEGAINESLLNYLEKTEEIESEKIRIKEIRSLIECKIALNKSFTISLYEEAVTYFLNAYKLDKERDFEFLFDHFSKKAKEIECYYESHFFNSSKKEAETSNMNSPNEKRFKHLMKLFITLIKDDIRDSRSETDSKKTSIILKNFYESIRDSLIPYPVDEKNDIPAQQRLFKNRDKKNNFLEKLGFSKESLERFGTFKPEKTEKSEVQITENNAIEKNDLNSLNNDIDIQTENQNSFSMSNSKQSA